ncbi:MAG: hypothetical protein ACFFEO_01700 [Candidatus Thorarchaeota archaeon]
MLIYWLGVLLAVLSGISHFLGMLIEKIIINQLSADAKLMRSLVKSPSWIFALFLRFGLGTIFFLMAQVFIGPAIIPGLMASGLIVLAIGSVKVIGEKLTLPEILAIFMMVGAISFLGLSELSIELSEYNLLQLEFIVRMTVFTLALAIIALVFHFIQAKYGKFRGILLALLSGSMFSLSNFWTGILMGVITKVFSGIFNIGELVLFIVSVIVLVAVNLLGVTKMAAALRYGDASKLVPIQNLPTQTTPSVIYFLVFLLLPPSTLSIIFFILAIMLIIASSFILAKRQAELDKIKQISSLEE